MTQFQIPDKTPLPFAGNNEKLFKHIKNSAKRRNLHPLHFLLKKIKNTIFYRLAYFCPVNSIRIFLHRQRGIHIGKNVYISQQCSIDNAYPEMIFIDDYAAVNQGCTILAHTFVRPCFEGLIECSAAPIYIKHHALVSINSTVLPGVEIGEYAVVCAGSVVTKNIKPYTMVVGNPARKVIQFKHLLKNND